MEYVLTILIILLIFKEEIKGIFVRNKPIYKMAETEKYRMKLRKEEFDKMMAYSVNDAIRSKRGEK